MRWLSENPDKAWMERYVLLYSPIWMVIITVVQFGGFLANWTDWQHLVLGLVLCLPLWAAPWVARDRPRAAAHAERFNLVILLLSVLQAYFGSKLFFNAFGMQYHFNTRLMLNGTPVFLYLLTVAYFSTYYVIMGVLLRAFRTRRPVPGQAAQWIARAVISYAVAFAETATMANERLSAYFSYRDPKFVMLWGSICYGTIFFITLPLFTELDEDPKAAPDSNKKLVWRTLALNMLCLCVYEVYSSMLT